MASIKIEITRDGDTYEVERVIDEVQYGFNDIRLANGTIEGHLDELVHKIKEAMK